MQAGEVAQNGMDQRLCNWSYLSSSVSQIGEAGSARAGPAAVNRFDRRSSDLQLRALDQRGSGSVTSNSPSDSDSRSRLMSSRSSTRTSAFDKWLRSQSPALPVASEASEPGRDRPGQLGCTRASCHARLVRLAQSGKDRPRQLAAARAISDVQVGEIAELGSDRPRQRVGAAVQRNPRLVSSRRSNRLGSALSTVLPSSSSDRRLHEVSQPGRDRPRQLVARQSQRLQLGERAQLGRDRTRQLVAVEIQRSQVREVA